MQTVLISSVFEVLFFPCLKFDLTKQQNDFKITLKTLEDNLLSRLSSASGNFLSDTELVENLETTKRTAAEIEEKVFVFYFFNHLFSHFRSQPSSDSVTTDYKLSLEHLPLTPSEVFLFSYCLGSSIFNIPCPLSLLCSRSNHLNIGCLTVQPKLFLSCTHF